MGSHRSNISRWVKIHSKTHEAYISEKIAAEARAVAIQNFAAAAIDARNQRCLPDAAMDALELDMAPDMFVEAYAELIRSQIKQNYDIDILYVGIDPVHGTLKPAPRYQPSLLIDFFVPFERAQDMHANLEEVYPLWIERHGERKARLIRHCQVAVLIAGTWWEKLLSTAERILKVARLSG